jgi:hypothetical protein
LIFRDALLEEAKPNNDQNEKVLVSSSSQTTSSLNGSLYYIEAETGDVVCSFENDKKQVF